MKQPRKPLIELLVEHFDEYSAKELYSIIMCGQIKVAGETVRDPRRKVPADSEFIITSRRWVSRGGEKLDRAVEEWKIDVTGKTVIDAGSSTGGFTDCLLQHGAKLVHAVDVGYNQLDYKLRTDPRVNVLERTNVMGLKNLEPPPDFAVADLSFRSISGAASHILKMTSENILIALIKPQFEIEKTEGFDGIIRDQEVLEQVLDLTAAALEREGVAINDVIVSPIKGGKGNTEFLFRLSLADEKYEISNRNKIKDFFDTVLK